VKHGDFKNTVLGNGLDNRSMSFVALGARSGFFVQESFFEQTNNSMFYGAAFGYNLLSSRLCLPFPRLLCTLYIMFSPSFFFRSSETRPLTAYGRALVTQFLQALTCIGTLKKLHSEMVQAKSIDDKLVWGNC